MAPKPKQQKGRDGALSLLNVAIDGFNLAKEVSSATPAKAVFGSVSILLAMIKDTMGNERDFVDLGLRCADICKALERGINKKKPDDLSQSLCEAMNQLNTTIEEIQGRVTEQSGRNSVSRFAHYRSDKDMIVAWQSELDRILQVFNTELAISTQVTVSDIRDDVSKIREEIGGQVRSTQTSMPGESPPPMPRACFGRDELIKKTVDLAENLHPMALIGAGGIGKTSIALTVLHHDRIKERFGDHRRFIRCDQFPASQTDFLAQLSKVTGAGIGNPEDLASLRQYLSSQKMFIVLDNAESILDPQGKNGQDIYELVEELSQFPNICLCITSRISTIPPDCETLDIPTLSMEAGCDAFYRIYKRGGRSDLVGDILKQLDFHPLSVTLLATVAHQNKWDNNRLAKEWEERQTGVLRTGHNKSLAGTIELSLASPMFKELGTDARGLLGVVAFFPQGVDEKNLGWLFPTISNGSAVFDTFCILSLTYRNEGFITMLAPLRDYLSPNDPASSPLLCTAKERYFTRLSVDVYPDKPTFGDTRWIVLEDVNAEHLLDVFISIDPNSDDVWDACKSFLLHLYWHKPRYTTLRQKIEGLPDEYPPKRRCLFYLAWLLGSVGNLWEEQRLLTHVLELDREGGNDGLIACTLRSLSIGERLLHRFEEGIQHAREALDIYQRLNDPAEQAKCLGNLAWLLYGYQQYDAAEEAASRAIGLLPEKAQEYLTCQSHRVLGDIHHSKGEGEKAVHHFGEALRIASAFKWSDELFWIHYSLAELSSDEGEFDDTHAHIEQAKSYAVDDPHPLGRAMELRADILYEEGRFEEAASEALCALEVHEKIGAVEDVEDCRDILRRTEKAMESQPTSGESASDGEPLETMLLPPPADSPLLAYCTPSDDSDRSPSPQAASRTL